MPSAFGCQFSAVSIVCPKVCDVRRAVVVVSGTDTHRTNRATASGAVCARPLLNTKQPPILPPSPPTPPLPRPMLDFPRRSDNNPNSSNQAFCCLFQSYVVVKTKWHWTSFSQRIWIERKKQKQNKKHIQDMSKSEPEGCQGYENPVFNESIATITQWSFCGEFTRGKEKEKHLVGCALILVFISIFPGAEPCR